MTEKERFSVGRNALGMQFICYDDDGILVGTFVDKIALKEIVDLLNEQDKEIKQLKDELFDVTKNLIYETSSDFEKDIEEARKDIYGDDV